MIVRQPFLKNLEHKRRCIALSFSHADTMNKPVKTRTEMNNWIFGIFVLYPKIKEYIEYSLRGPLKTFSFF